MTQSFIAIALVLQATTTSLPTSLTSHPSPVSLRQTMHEPGVYATPSLPIGRARMGTAPRPRSTTRTFFGVVTGALAGGFLGLFVGATLGAGHGNDGDLTGAAIGLPGGALAGGILGGYFFGK